MGVLKQVNSRQGTGEQGHLRSPRHCNQPFGVRAHLKDTDTGISQGVPFPGSGAEQGEAEEEEDAAHTAQPRHPLRWALVSFTPPAQPARPQLSHIPQCTPDAPHCSVSPPHVPTFHPPRCIHGWTLGVLGPWSTPGTSSAEQHQPGGCCGGHGERGAPAAVLPRCGSPRPAVGSSPSSP